LLLTQVPAKKDSWMNVRGSIRDVYIGWVVGDGLAGKFYCSNCGRALVKPKNLPGGVVLAPLWLK